MIDIITAIVIMSIVSITCVMLARTESRRVVRAETGSDITTIPQVPIIAASCIHHWKILSDQVLEMPHQKRHSLILCCSECGAIDKTAQITSPVPPPPPQPRSECHHNWCDEKSATVDSAFEQMSKADNKSGNNKHQNITWQSANDCQWMFRKVYIKIRICRKCGEIDKTIVSNFEIPDDQVTTTKEA